MSKSSKRKAHNSSFPIPLLILGSGVILLIVAIVLLSQAGQQGNLTPESIPRVSVTESKAALDSGEAVILDVRSISAYQSKRISGAVSIPLEELSYRMTELEKDKWIITYCT